MTSKKQALLTLHNAKDNYDAAIERLGRALQLVNDLVCDDATTSEDFANATENLTTAFRAIKVTKVELDFAEQLFSQATGNKPDSVPANDSIRAWFKSVEAILDDVLGDALI